MCIGYSNDEATLARLAFLSKGKIHRMLTGELCHQDISLDGAFVFKAKILRSKVKLSTGNFVLRESEIGNSEFFFEGGADNIKQLVLMLANQSNPSQIIRPPVH